MSDLSPEELLQIHKQYADTFAAIAQSGLASAFDRFSQSNLFKYNPARITITAPDFGTPNKNIDLPFAPPSPKLPELDALVLPLDVPNPDYTDAPPNTLTRIPVYVPPQKPPQVPGWTEPPPSINTAVILPPDPNFLPMGVLVLPYPTISTPLAPSITMPVFEGRRPNDIVVPDPATIVNSYTTEQAAHRNMLPGFMQTNTDALITKYAPEYNALRSQINNAIVAYTNSTTGGGIGIPVQIEQAITARASDKNNIEFQRALETAADTIAKQGFSIPSGALLATLRQARTAMGDAQVRGNIELATKNLELEQQNFQFMLKLGEALEEKMMDVITQYLQLMLRMDELSIQSAKEIVTAYLGAYNLQVLVYKALWDGYQVDAEVFKAKISALESQIRLYEAEIKAELAKTEINKAHVDILRAIADVNQAFANTYKVRLEAAMAPLEVARVQLALYESKIRAFAAQVQVYEAQWGGYKAEVEGEVGKLRGYEAQATAYTAQVNGFKAQVDGFSARVASVGEANKAIQGRNEATIKVFSTQAEVAIKTFEGLIAAYSAESNVAIRQAEIEVEYWRTTANLIMQEYTTTMHQTFEFAREQMNLFRGQMEAAISAGTGLAQVAAVAGNLAGGAMAGLTSFAGKLVNSDA